MKAPTLLYTLFTLMLLSCGSNQVSEIKAGSICTVDAEKGFGVVKVLVINDDEAHIKIYKNKYSVRPNSVDIKTLSLGSINDKDGFGIGHVPMDRKGFDTSNPVVIGFEKVTKEDLKGYEMWKNQ